MTVRLALLAQLEAKPGKGEELGAFLETSHDICLSSSSL
jgi:hypothetical protein